MYKKAGCTCRIVVLIILTYCFFEVLVLKLPPESEVDAGCILQRGYWQHYVTNLLSYIWGGGWKKVPDKVQEVGTLKKMQPCTTQFDLQ